MQDLSKETVTFRNSREEQALPMRKLGSFLLGEGVGGAGVHWNGVTWRFWPYDFEIKSQTEEKYGADKVDKDITIQDWGITYDELEPYYDKFEKTLGISGEEDPLGAPRSDKYPTPPMKTTPILERFKKACSNLDYNPFHQPSERKSTRLNSSHVAISYAVFCLKKKTQ